MATVNEKMTALADSIRAKSGATGKLSLDGMKTAVDGIETGGGSSGVQYEIVTIPAGATSATYSLPHITKAVGSVNENLVDQENECYTITSIYDNLVNVLWGVESGTSWYKPFATFDSYLVTYSNGNITWDAGNVAVPITLLLIYDPNEPYYFDT